MKNFKRTYLIFLVVGLILTAIANLVPFSFAERAIPDICNIGATICGIVCAVLWFKARKANKKQDEKEKNNW